MPDLLAPLEPPPADVERLVGTIDGPPGWREGFGAGLRCWCGPGVGWRDLGDVSPAPCVTLQGGRLRVAMSWDLGAHSLPRRAGSDEQDG